MRRALAQSPSLRAGAGLLAMLLLFSLATSLFGVNPNHQDLNATYAPPGTAGHMLGTDPLGRDVLSWIGGGIRVGLMIGLAVATIAAFVGTLVGLLAGYTGGRATDSLLMRLVDLQLAVPPLLLFIAAAAVISPSMTSIVLLLAIPSWVPYARLVRTAVLSERERGYVAAARLAGTSHVRIIAGHLLPACASLIVIMFSLQVGYVLLWESALSFLGLGVQPPSTSLGFLISQGQEDLLGSWWVAALPGLTIMLMVLSFNLIGDGLRDVLRPDVEG